mmetsp:Transcript_7533/g.18825  ORF Transcript_7533/g.18825 Transcript_7533/m.18825 type:complete len:328 (+) Transcript_7533:132-1115(+)|eukprot:CAMPEP_0172396326 /NCGR_PEP_ID=MMETSP1061-20121228/24462_1 /TAXON_ID=37318 /ORGANISM="Pseudo-nitzschia pungens, Strain cf. pungens" /LENGTH=327 /DNA_ID=CAMNT_0013128137 /DNA_START=120 /DNA_END=1103 /DNA_ORIENTATION=-
MGVARTNSPTTVSQQVVEDVEKNSDAIRSDAHIVTSQEREKELPYAQQPEYLEEGDDSAYRTQLKSKLRGLLAEHNGYFMEEVEDTVKKLSELNPHPTNCAQLELFTGDYYTLTTPNFPGRLKTPSGDEDIVQYTLGRLSFNIFQPNELVCTVKSIRNPVHPQYDQYDKTTHTFSYPLIVELTIHTPDGDLDATLINRGFCRPHEDKNNRMMVTFRGGSLIPGNKGTVDDGSMLALWDKTFANVYKKADEERSYLGWIYRYFLKLILGLTLPSDAMSHYENAFHFDIKRTPKGFFDVLYLDDDMRITRGNRGTISVLERAPMNSYAQ